MAQVVDKDKDLCILHSHIIAANDLAPCVAKASVGIVLTNCSRIVSVAGQKWLTHWGRVTYMCVTKLTSIGSDNGLSRGRWQTII